MIPETSTLESVQTEAREAFLVDVRGGLARTPKGLPCKYLYDKHGSELFDRICTLDEYYPTRTEMRILGDHLGEMAARIGPRCLLIEPGSGNSAKTRPLLSALERPVAYVPVDISREHLIATADSLRREFPGLGIHPIAADFTGRFHVPPIPTQGGRRIVYFPGSTIGNFEPAEATALLHRFAETAGPGGGLLIGFDLRKPTRILHAAYNDGDGVTRAFNLNLLRRLRNELDADVDIGGFTHRAIYNPRHGRVEMHLVSRRRQTIVVGGTRFRFAKGETIHTENSYKYSCGGFTKLASAAGFAREAIWTDPRRWFAVAYFRTASRPLNS